MEKDTTKEITQRLYGLVHKGKSIAEAQSLLQKEYASMQNKHPTNLATAVYTYALENRLPLNSIAQNVLNIYLNPSMKKQIEQTINQIPIPLNIENTVEEKMSSVQLPISMGSVTKLSLDGINSYRAIPGKVRNHLYARNGEMNEYLQALKKIKPFEYNVKSSFVNESGLEVKLEKTAKKSIEENIIATQLRDHLNKALKKAKLSKYEENLKIDVKYPISKISIEEKTQRSDKKKLVLFLTAYSHMIASSMLN